MVACATSIRLSTSSASMRAVFQTWDLSLSVTEPTFSRIAAILTTPSSMVAFACGTRRRATAWSGGSHWRGLARRCHPGVLQLVQARQGAVAPSAGMSWWLPVFADRWTMCFACRLAEHQQVQQRVGAQAVGAMHRHRRAFAHGVQALDDVVLAAVPDHDLAVDVGPDAAHLVVDGGHHGDRLAVMSTLAKLWPISSTDGRRLWIVSAPRWSSFIRM